MDKTPLFDAVIITAPSDYKRTKSLHNRLTDYLPVRNIYVVSSKEVCPVIEGDDDERFIFVDENDIVAYDDVYDVAHSHLCKVYKEQTVPRGAVGWYYQQILKLEYSRISRDQYYLTWDGDTVPCKAFSMFSDDGITPYFDMKHEYRIEYFETINKLLPGYGKCVERSFISEHMLFDRDIVKEMINEIERNDSIEGDTWWKKMMIHSIPLEKYTQGCFAEFETYGSYVYTKYPGRYELRPWNSFRYAGYFLDPNNIQEKDWDWLSKDFYALSFEKNEEIREDYKNLFDNNKYQEKLSARQMLEICQEEMISGYVEVWEQ